MPSFYDYQQSFASLCERNKKTIVQDRRLFNAAKSIDRHFDYIETWHMPVHLEILVKRCVEFEKELEEVKSVTNSWGDRISLLVLGVLTICLFFL